MASYPLSLRWERVGVRVIPPIPKEGPLTLSTVEGSSVGRSTIAIPSRPHSPPHPLLPCHSEAPRGIWGAVSSPLSLDGCTTGDG